MKTLIPVLPLIVLLFSCTSKQKEKSQTPNQKTNAYVYTLRHPSSAFGLEKDTVTIFWTKKTFLGTPSLFKRNKLIQMTIKDCAEGYCHGTTIYFNENGFPIKEVSLNANSLYFNYEQEQSGVITDKKLSQDTNSIDYDYNYTKVIAYPENSFFYTETITFSDTSKRQVTYSYINDSINLVQEKQSTKIDTLMHSFKKYTGLVKNKPQWKIKSFNNNEFEVLMPGDIKVPGGGVFGGPLRIKYKLDDNKLITAIQYVNKFDVILKEVEVLYKKKQIDEFKPIKVNKPDGIYALANYKEGMSISTIQLVDQPAVNSSHFYSAFSELNSYGQQQIVLRLNREGTEQLLKLTLANTNKLIAIVVNNEIITAPRVHEPVSSGTIYINNDFSKDKLDEILNSLNKR